MRKPSVSTPSVRTPSIGIGPAGSNRPLLGAGGSTALSPLGVPLSGTAASAETAAGLLGAGGLQALAGSAAPRQLLGHRMRHALAHGSLTRHQLERVVARLHGCLGQLAPQQRRVLVLLAGVGPRPALSRRQVARRLGLGVAQTRRIERRALRRLGTLDDAGRCVAGGGSVTFAALLASTPLGLSDGSTLAAVGNNDAASGRPRSGIEGVSSSGGHDGGSALDSALPPPLGQGSDWTLLILLMLAALVVLLVRRELRRQRDH